MMVIAKRLPHNSSPQSVTVGGRLPYLESPVEDDVIHPPLPGPPLQV